MANFMGLVFATLKNEGIDTKGMSNDEAVKKFDELKGKGDGTPAEQRELQKNGITGQKTVRKFNKSWVENDNGDILSVKTKNGNIIKVGDKIQGYEVTELDPTTNSVILEGSDYSVEDVESLIEKDETKKVQIPATDTKKQENKVVSNKSPIKEFTKNDVPELKKLMADMGLPVAVSDEKIIELVNNLRKR